MIKGSLSHPGFQMKKPRHGHVMEVVQSHTAMIQVQTCPPNHWILSIWTNSGILPLRPTSCIVGRWVRLATLLCEYCCRFLPPQIEQLCFRPSCNSSPRDRLLETIGSLLLGRHAQVCPLAHRWYMLKSHVVNSNSHEADRRGARCSLSCHHVGCLFGCCCFFLFF